MAMVLIGVTSLTASLNDWALPDTMEVSQFLQLLAGLSIVWVGAEVIPWTIAKLHNFKNIVLVLEALPIVFLLTGIAYINPDIDIWILQALGVAYLILFALGKTTIIKRLAHVKKEANNDDENTSESA